jgi:hypothetical protein
MNWLSTKAAVIFGKDEVELSAASR